jgi:hypothetical protein
VLLEFELLVLVLVLLLVALLDAWETACDLWGWQWR